MSVKNVVGMIRDSDFHIDERGRMIIDNEALMREVNGAAYDNMGLSANSGCTNSGCK